MSRDPKIDRKALKKSDHFVKKGRAALDAVLREKRITMGALGALAVIVGLYYAYDWWSNRALNRDWVAYYQAEEAKGDERTTKLKQTYEQGSNTRAAYIAAVTLGDHYAESATYKVEAERVKTHTGKDPKADPKKKEELPVDPEPAMTKEQAAGAAGEWYGKALGFSGLLPGERELLMLDIGHALEIEGKWEDAATKYKGVVDLNGSTKPLAMLHLGRMHEMKKDPQGAKNLYQALTREFGSSEYATLAKNYLRRMDSPLLVPAGKP